MSREEQYQLLQEKDKTKIEFQSFQKVKNSFFSLLKLSNFKIILDFQSKSHEKFLRKFIILYRQVDKDNNGIADEKEFNELIVRMDVGKDQSDINRLLQIVDPYNNQQITFSQCVTLFSAVKIKKN